MDGDAAPHQARVPTLRHHGQPVLVTIAQDLGHLLRTGWPQCQGRVSPIFFRPVHIVPLQFGGVLNDTSPISQNALEFPNVLFRQLTLGEGYEALMPDQKTLSYPSKSLAGHSR